MGVQRGLDAEADELVTQCTAGIEVAAARSEGVENQADQALGGRRRWIEVPGRRVRSSSTGQPPGRTSRR